MRIFSINFNGGFAIVDNSTAMMNIINNEYSININEFDSIESANTTVAPSRKNARAVETKV